MKALDGLAEEKLALCRELELTTMYLADMLGVVEEKENYEQLAELADKRGKLMEKVVLCQQKLDALLNAGFELSGEGAQRFEKSQELLLRCRDKDKVMTEEFRAKYEKLMDDMLRNSQSMRGVTAYNGEVELLYEQGHVFDVKK